MSALPRFHVSGAAPGALDLPEEAGHHVTRVLRLAVGDRIRVFDAGAEFEATLTSVSKRGVAVNVGEAVRAAAERPVALHLIMSPLKGDLTELVIQKATELGVARVSPVVFERTDTVARRDPSEGRLSRWRRVAVSAAEQSGRAVVPELDGVQPIEKLLEALGALDGDEARIVAAEPSLGLPLEKARPEAHLRRVRVAVGPAGGFGPRDLELLGRAGFRAESFALHTLRAETACLAALSILGARFAG